MERCNQPGSRTESESRAGDGSRVGDDERRSTRITLVRLIRRILLLNLLLQSSRNPSLLLAAAPVIPGAQYGERREK